MSDNSLNPHTNADACNNAEEKACTTVEERRLSAASSAKEDAGFSPGGRTFYATMFAAIILLALSAQAQKPASASLTADLPAGPMQAKATTACLECHEARIILQQRLSKGAWTKEVDKMVKWGAVVDRRRPRRSNRLSNHKLQPRPAPLQPATNQQLRKNQVAPPSRRLSSGRPRPLRREQDILVPLHDVTPLPMRQKAKRCRPNARPDITAALPLQSPITSAV